MKSCPQCFAPYPDEYSVCPRDGAALSGASVWAAGSVIRGKYQILGKIGEGGMAAVYRAHHTLLDEPRALKVIGGELARDPQFVERFKTEAIITRRLRHPNAVRVDDLDIAEDGRPFIALELVEGENLKAWISRAGPLAADAVLDIAWQVCAALEAAHALGLIHRDVKPDNIVLVPRTGTAPLVKILDFGIARLREGIPGAARPAMTLTGTGVVIGTPDYMSPEQAMGKRGDQLDGRSDLYSLGIVMYRMLTGELPFKAETTVEMILHHIQTIPRPPQALKPELHIPDAVSTIVMKALEKDRQRRFASAREMAEALRAAQGELTRVARAPGTLLAVGGMPTTTPAGSRAAALVPGGAAAKSASSQAVPLAARPPVQLPPAAPVARRDSFSFRIGLRKGGFSLRIGMAVGFVAACMLVVVSLRHRQASDGEASGLPALSTPAASPPRRAAAPPQAAMMDPRKLIKPGDKVNQKTAPSTAVKRPGGGSQSEASSGATSSANRGKEGSNVLQPSPRILHGRAKQLMIAHEFERAAQIYRKLLEVNPDDRRAQTGLRFCLQKMRHAQPPRARPKP